MGATGVLDIDGLTVETVSVEAEPTTNLVVNGDFELGDPAPAGWVSQKDAKRVFPGFNSSAAAELRERNSRLQTGLGTTVSGFDGLEISMAVRGVGAAGSGGGVAAIFFLDDFGKPVPNHERGDSFLSWSDSFDWRIDRAQVQVPAGETPTVLQIDKLDSGGAIRFDDIQITATPNPAAGSWTPYRESDDTDEWLELSPSRSIKPGSALDVSFLLQAPAGQRGQVAVKDGHLTFQGKDRARFFGVDLLPPAAFQPAENAEALADRLARSGINLVRLGDLDSA